MNMYENTSKFYDKSYIVNNKKGYRLLEGDTVLIHPTNTSISRKPYQAKIVLRPINWTGVGSYELCTEVKDGHAAVINDYLFNRLELVKE
jgi:hypothetical protein